MLISDFVNQVTPLGKQHSPGVAQLGKKFGDVPLINFPTNTNWEFIAEQIACDPDHVSDILRPFVINPLI